jgi:Uma2 family endonuclease
LLARYGVREYWIVDPEAARVEVYDFEKGGYESGITNPSRSIRRAPSLRRRS